MLVSFSAAYFTGALVTDLVYWHMPDVLWERFSIWLIWSVTAPPPSRSSRGRAMVRPGTKRVVRSNGRATCGAGLRGPGDRPGTCGAGL